MVLEMKATSRKGAAPAVKRAVAILRLLGKSPVPLGVNAIANKLGLIPSTCLHILRELISEELVAIDPVTKHYRLDAGILVLARSVLRPSNFVRMVQPALEQVSSVWQITAVAVQVVSLDHIVVSAISERSSLMRIHVEVGSRFPALMSATGRCLAAFSPFEAKEVEARFKKIRWDVPPTLSDWRLEVKAARLNHYSVDEGQYLSGITVVAAPILDASSYMTHGIISFGVSDQVKRVGVTRIGQC